MGGPARALGRLGLEPGYTLVYDFVHSGFRRSVSGLGFTLTNNTFHGGQYGGLASGAELT